MRNQRHDPKTNVRQEKHNSESTNHLQTGVSDSQVLPTQSSLAPSNQVHAQPLTPTVQGVQLEPQVNPQQVGNPPEHSSEGPQHQLQHQLVPPLCTHLGI